MTRRGATTLRRTDGFTLPELLTVILIIGVLAAIAVPLFASQRAKANDANAKALARTGMSAMETYHAENDDYRADAASLRQIAPELDQASWSLTGGASTYTIRVRSKTGTSFTIGRPTSDGPLERSCTAPDAGGCPASGSW